MDDQYIRQRLIEAVDTEWRLPPEKLGPDGFSAYWPEYQNDRSDMNGWGPKRWAQHMEEKRRTRIPPSSDEIARYEQCLLWRSYVRRTEDRIAMARWALCQAKGGSFASWCRARIGEQEKGGDVAEATAEKTGKRRVARAIRDILNARGNGASIAALEMNNQVSLNEIETGIETSMLGERMRGAGHPLNWRADDAIPGVCPEAWERRRA